MTKKPKPRCTPKNGKTHPWKCAQPTTAQHKEMLEKGERSVPIGAMMGMRK
jgi:hypothetical protein